MPRSHLQDFMPRLPAELTDRVIDHLHADHLTLATCSLVCKTWLPASRHHLFEITKICLTEINIHSFVKLLNSPTTSTFFGHALNVSINVGEHRSARSIFDTLSHHLFRLKIKSLKLESMMWDIDEKREELFEYFAKIPTLELHNVAFQFQGSPPRYTNSKIQFLKFITSFLSLERLHLDGIFILEPDVPFTLPPLLRFVHLNMATHSMAPYLSSVQWPPLSSLTISHIRREDMGAIQAVLESLGSSLHDLTISFARLRAYIS